MEAATVWGFHRCGSLRGFCSTWAAEECASGGLHVGQKLLAGIHERSSVGARPSSAAPSNRTTLKVKQDHLETLRGIRDDPRNTRTTRRLGRMRLKTLRQSK